MTAGSSQTILLQINDTIKWGEGERNFRGEKGITQDCGSNLIRTAEFYSLIQAFFFYLCFYNKRTSTASLDPTSILSVSVEAGIPLQGAVL